MDKEKNATEHNTTRKENAVENVAETTEPAEPPSRAGNELEPEPLKTRYIISSDSDKGEQNEDGYEDDSTADDYDELFQ